MGEGLRGGSILPCGLSNSCRLCKQGGWILFSSNERSFEGESRNVLDVEIQDEPCCVHTQLHMKLI